ncbi:uncharacterized protein [Phaseolus vulgaris]|uniref:uncharacterized protein n=1 Tax=Phaseolus vulgaris TaxID=3885 RepID=UPI0035CB0D08
MVLQDQQGVRIHACVRRTLIYKFQSQISEGHVYSIQSFSVASNLGSYRITKHAYKINFQYGTKSCELFCESSFRIQCTLFGTYVDKLNAFLSTGEVDNAVISIEFAKVKFFRDNIYVQNCIDCTRVEYNVLTEEALLLKKRYKVQLRVIDDTDSTTFMLFDREASSLLSKSCVEMFESHDKNGNLPNEFAQILEKKVLFKVDSKMDKGFRCDKSGHNPKENEDGFQPRIHKPKDKLTTFSYGLNYTQDTVSDIESTKVHLRMQ